MLCRLVGDRVELEGTCVFYLEGEVEDLSERGVRHFGLIWQLRPQATRFVDASGDVLTNPAATLLPDRSE